MEAEVARQLGMERRDPDRTLPAEHRRAVVVGEHLDRLTDPLDHRRPDEHARESRPSSPCTVSAASNDSRWRP